MPGYDAVGQKVRFTLRTCGCQNGGLVHSPKAVPKNVTIEIMIKVKHSYVCICLALATDF